MIAAWLLLGLLTAPADLPAGLEQAILAAPRPEDRPEAGAVYLRHDRVFQVDARGRVELTLHETIKILRDAGRAYRTIYLPWITPYQTLTVREARTVLPDLKAVDVSQVALQAMLPRQFGERPDALPPRYRLNFPYVEPGAVIDYEVVVTETQPSMPGHFADVCQLRLPDPAVSARYVVRTPGGAVFNRHIGGDPGEDAMLDPPTVTRRGDWNETVWQARNLPALPDEPQRPSDDRLALTVMVSSWPSWGEVAAQYRDVARTQYVARDEALLAEGRRAAQGAADRVAALYHLVSSRVQYAFGPFERGMPGIQPRTADETWHLREGDCKDQTTLLITLLRLNGFVAWPALVRRSPAGPVAEDLPAMLQFDHTIVAVPVAKGRYRWLDPTWSFGPSDYLPNDLQGARALVVRDQDAVWETLPPMSAADNVLTRTAELTVDAAGNLSGRVVVNATGGFEQTLRNQFHGRSREAAAREVATGLNAALSGVRFDPAALELSPVDDLTVPFRLGYTFQAPGYARRLSHLVLVELAVFEHAEPPAGTLIEPRRTPLRLAVSPERTVNRLLFTIPPELTLDAEELPQDRERRAPFGTWKVTVQRRGPVVEWRRQVDLLRDEVAPEEVPAVRAWYEALAEADRQMLVLRRRTGP